MLYRFEGFELDEDTEELRRGDEVVPMQPKPFELLRVLIRERARIVPTRELLQLLWPETAVTPSSLTRAVSLARRAIGDTHQGAMLRSHARRGYRFCAPVEECPPSPIPPPPRAAPPEAAERVRPTGRPELPDPAGPPTRPPAPDPPREVSPFIGREDARQLLRDARTRAATGRGSVVIVRGPAGIGKTRLTEVFIEETRQAGWLSQTGRCRDGDGVPVYWLWVQILRQLLENPATRDEVRTLAGCSEEIAGLIPELGPARPSSGSRPSSDQGRFLFYDAVTGVLIRCARQAGLVLVLEDLQWAGLGSLRLLEHMLFEISSAPLMLIVTVREEPRERGHPLHRTLSSLKRQDGCEEIALRGFSRGEVGQLLERVIGRAPPVDLTSELYARTEGVPLFLREAIRLLSERGALQRVEQLARHGVRLPGRALDLIRRALESLTEPCAALMGAASVMGREFGLPAAAEVLGISREEALELLDEAVSSGIVAAVPDAPTTFRFSHALYQEAAYRGLRPSTRSRLHHRAAERLERVHAEDLEQAISELAHHHHRSLAVGDPTRTVSLALRAAERALRVFAHGQAAEHYEQALEALDCCEPVDPARRLDTLIQLGEALMLAGERQRSRETLERAMQAARSLRRPLDFARAAIAFCDLSDWAPHDRSTRFALEEALEGLGSSDSPEHTRLLTRLAFTTPSDSRQDAHANGRRAVASARALGDADALLEALYTLHFLLAGPDRFEERAQLTAEMAGMAGDCTRLDSIVIALLDVASDRISLGDAEEARSLRARAGSIAGAQPHPRQVWHMRVYDTGMAILEGRFDEARVGIQEAYVVGQRIEHPYALGCRSAHLASLAFETGDPERILSEMSPFAAVPGSPVHWIHALMGRAHVLAGRLQEAHALLEDLAAREFEDIPRNIRWTDTMVQIAGLCLDLESPRYAKALIEQLEPVRHHHGVMPIPICYAGPVTYYLGGLQHALGRADEARALLGEALNHTERLRARPMRARILLAHGALLAEQHDSDAAASLREALTIADELGQRPLAAAAQSRLNALT